MGVTSVIKIWGRNTSSNVQKVMWAIGEIGLPHERIDIGGPFGKNREPAYLAMNPNGLVPTLEEEDGFLLWESNTIVRYLAAKHRSGVLEPADRACARARQCLDGLAAQRSRPRDHPVFVGLIRTPPEKRDPAVIEDSKKRTTDAIAMLDAALGQERLRRRRRFLLRRHSRRRHGQPLSPAGAANGRHCRHFERWYAAIAARPGVQRPGRRRAAGLRLSHSAAARAAPDCVETI